MKESIDLILDKPIMSQGNLDILDTFIHITIPPHL